MFCVTPTKGLGMMGEEESGLLEIQLALDIILPGQGKSHVCCEIPLLIFLNPPPSLEDLGKKTV